MLNGGQVRAALPRCALFMRRWPLFSWPRRVFAEESPKESSAADLASMVDAERAFATAAKKVGIKAAFLEYLDDEAVALQPTLGRAKDVWRSRPDPADPLKAKLTWEPRTGQVASSGDLGWLTGPYVFMPEAGAPASYGCYFSVWTRSPGRPWRVALDQGIDTSEPCVFPGAGFKAAKVARWAGPVAAREEARATLLARDGELAASGARDAGAAIAGALDAAGRVYRPGRQNRRGRRRRARVSAHRATTDDHDAG